MEIPAQAFRMVVADKGKGRDRARGRGMKVGCWGAEEIEGVAGVVLAGVQAEDWKERIDRIGCDRVVDDG